jgi:hypothetical protein
MKAVARRPKAKTVDDEAVWFAISLEYVRKYVLIPFARSKSTGFSR